MLLHTTNHLQPLVNCQRPQKLLRRVRFDSTRSVTSEIGFGLAAVLTWVTSRLPASLAVCESRRTHSGPLTELSSANLATEDPANPERLTLTGLVGAFRVA